jgi:hypothetical protein
MKGSGRHLDEASRKLTADSSRHSQGVDANERRLLAGRPQSPAKDSRGEPDGFPTVWVAPLSPAAVQPSTDPRADRLPPASRARTQLLSRSAAGPRIRGTQLKRSPENPGRFRWPILAMQGSILTVVCVLVIGVVVRFAVFGGPSIS